MTFQMKLDEMFKHDLNNHDYLKICEENHNCEILQLKVKKCIFIIEYAARLDIFGPVCPYVLSKAQKSTIFLSAPKICTV